MKKALLVGIDKYQDPMNNLGECVKDMAVKVRDILMKYCGFKVSDIRVLTNERATYSNIIERVEWLVSTAVPNDHLFYGQSSHGSHIRDRNGDELSDGLDEILCPHDITWDANFIADDKLAEIFRKLPEGVTLDVMFDLCHSKTATRNCYGAVRYLLPPIDIQCRSLGEKLKLHRFGSGWLSWLFGDGTAAENDEVSAQDGMNHCLFSACEENQSAMETPELGGVFTHFFCRHIEDTGGDITRGDLIKKVRASIKDAGFEQVPSLEAPAWMLDKRLCE
jgi:hypothetical protein